MFPEERQQKIYDLVCERKSVKVTELSSLLRTSEVTIRRDLEELHNQSKVQRTHGGAIALYSVANEVSAQELISGGKCVEEKRRIAVCAYGFVGDGDTIFADSSSTVHELVKLIAQGKRTNLLVITSSLLTVNTLAGCPNAKVIMLGGEVNYRHGNMEGHLTKMVIRSLRADKCFLGINGIDETFGYSTPRFPDAEAKSLILESSIQSFILADNTKFNKTYLARLTAGCDTVITDRRLVGYDYGWLEERVSLVFAGEG